MRTNDVALQPRHSDDPRASRWRPRLRLAAVIGVAALALAGCAPGSGPEPTSGGTLRVGIATLSDADALDPANATTTGGYVIARQLFDTLTEYGPDGAWHPQLAKSVEPGDTADVWTVTLADAKWSDGRPVTAADVVATVKRWFDEKLPPAGNIPMVDPAKVTAVDDHTVEFHLSYPTVTFPEAFASPTMSIVPADFDPKKPIGSGPFVLESNDPGVQLVFTANAGYFRGAPGVKSLQIVSFADASSEVTALTAGQIDVAANVDPTLAGTVKAASGYSVFDYPTSGTLTWVMNTQKAPFTDPVVMQALRLAVDRQALIDQVYSGYATLGNDYFSPFDPLYDKDLPQRSYDPEKAKSLLEGAGYTLPVAIELWGTDNTPTSSRQNEVLVTQAKAAGFDITFNHVDSATFYGDAYGTYPLSLSYWGFLGIFDQAAFTITATAPYNSSHWTNPAYDELFTKAIQTVDDGERADLVHQMQKIEYEQGAYIVPLFLNALVGVSNSVTGMQAYPNSDGAFGYNFWTLSLG